MLAPPPYEGPAPEPVTRDDDPVQVASSLVDGAFRLVTDRYRTGQDVLAALRRGLPLGHRDLKTSRAARHRYHAASQRLLAPVRGHRLALKKSPEIGWFAELYPERPDLLLPFPQVQGLNSSWQWYARGVKLPVIEQTLHPLHGVYFPTRHEHLHLFARWLGAHQGPRGRAVDVGTGCGVLAIMLAEAGYASVRATDTNPNAVESLRRDLAESPYRAVISPTEASLLGEEDGRFDLIVFNPPWLPGEPQGLLDQAIYYPPKLFDDFFAAAWRALAPDGRVVLLFSDLLQRSGVSRVHPIARELKRRKRFVRDALLEARVEAASSKTRRRRREQSREQVQLWVLKRR